MTLWTGQEIYRIALGDGASADRWQRKFAEEEWPEVLIAPTGSGKTAAVTLGWLTRRLLALEHTPRRLVWCLPMRTLVGQTTAAVNAWLERIMASGVDARGVLPRPHDDVHVLMGGAEAGRWLDTPERSAVLVGTQDMLLSRALMRGYASSRANWPMEFALLHEDAQWVFDEVQLMGAGRATSAQLEAFRRREAERTGDCRKSNQPARSLWTSATLDPCWLRTVDYSPPTLTTPEGRERVWKVDPGQEGGRLSRLTTAKKPLRRADVAPAGSKAEDIKSYVRQLASLVLRMHEPGRMTLVIVNRVNRAQALHTALCKELVEKRVGVTDLALALVHSRFRPADRRREVGKIPVEQKDDGAGSDLIVVSTQAVEAGMDISAAVLITELAPWPSMVQRFGRANRYAELPQGAKVYWVDLVGEQDDRNEEELARPYDPNDLQTARQHLSALTDAAPAHLPPPGDVAPPRRVIRRKDLDDLFDTDPDLTGFDVDISAYVRDATDTDVHVFWRDLSSAADTVPPHPLAEELCAVPIGAAKDWLKKARKPQGTGSCVFVRDPQWRRGAPTAGGAPPGWMRLWEDPWPGLTLLVDTSAGGYTETLGFTGDIKHVPQPIAPTGEPVPGSASGDPLNAGEADGHDEDSLSEIGIPVALGAHLGHVAREAGELCDALRVDAETRAAIVRAARWHDLGKAHEAFQDTMRRGLGGHQVADGLLLAKTVARNLRHKRPYFRHELASALAFLDHESYSREADLVAYLVAAHHGKVRMNLRALPRERQPSDKDRVGARFARGVWEGDLLPSVDLGEGERWAGGGLTLSVMELGFDEVTRESWTERTRDLLARFGPFRLAWMETLLRVADWRASGKEQRKQYGDA